MSSDTAAANGGARENGIEKTGRSNSFSQQSTTSENSQTAADFIRSQELLEADAREALPYSIDSCTNILGPLRQNVFACLTCTPPPTSDSDTWTPAGVCYACSIQCHGEHTLVEIFQKRNFTCDCGTKRIPSTSPCTLRTNSETNLKGDVHSEEPDANNRYNQNFKNRFCGCECDYDPFQQKGTMFQCLGLGTAETGGCGEDWYHPGCLVGMGPQWYEKMEKPKKASSPAANGDGALPTISEDAEGQPEPKTQGEETKHDIFDEEEEDEPPLPPGFPDEEAFEGFICYKCVESNPWIKHYVGTSGFLAPVFLNGGLKEQPAAVAAAPTTETNDEGSETASKKRKADDDDGQSEAKRVKSETDLAATDKPSTVDDKPTNNTTTTPPAQSTEATTQPTTCKLPNLTNPPPSGRFSLFFKEDFRNHFCHCKSCYLHLNTHPQLLEEEEVYEPPISEGANSDAGGGSTHGSNSLLERGESALRNVDRVRAIEGVMAYQHLKERLKPFFQQFAESGQAVGAEDIKAYFAKLRGDEEGMKEAGEKAKEDGDQRKEQGGY